jgi:hypothetical protein
MTTPTTTGPLLPAGFADLEPFAARWALATEAERYAERLSSSMTDMQAFYDAAFPRLEAALAHCDALDITALPEDAKHLMHLMFSLVNVSFPVEAWKQPNVPDSGAASMDLVHEPML